jgi:methyltransferase (TIGR00027 family)
VPERPRGPSRTAAFVALFRALESRLPADRRLFEDPFAPAFLEPRLRAVLALARVPVTGALVAKAIDRGWPGARAGVVVRTRFIDGELEAALADGIGQVAILGAGFDTRAYRIEGVQRAQVFEIDEPATLAVKRARMERVLGALPGHVSLVAMDFEHDDLGARLNAAGLRREARTMFICEGVTSYLTAAGVDATFRRVSALAATGSRLAFTYLDRAALEGRSDLPGARAAIAAVRRAGEPFQFGLDPGDLPAYLADRGLELLEDASTAELAVRYLHPLGRRPPASPFYRVALAACRS